MSRAGQNLLLPIRFKHSFRTFSGSPRFFLRGRATTKIRNGAQAILQCLLHLDHSGPVTGDGEKKTE